MSSQATPTREEISARLDPWVSFLRAHAAITRELSAQLQRRYGLTLNDYEVLVHLSAGGPLTIGEQAEHLGLRRNSASELLARLEAKGLVARIRYERDERRVLVWLTDAGRDVVARVGQVLAPDLIAETMATLSPAERAIVVRGFELLAAASSTQNSVGASVRTSHTERTDS